MTDWKAASADACELLIGVLGTVADAHLDQPTPCAGWTVADLVAHQRGQEHGFASAFADGGEEPADWVPIVGGADAPALLSDALRRTEQAIAAAELDSVWMPEITTRAALPVEVALGARVVDLLVHGWDLATALGRPFAVPDHLGRLVLAVAEPIPDGDVRRTPGAAFAPSRPRDDSTDPFTQALALLGRDPVWQPAG